MKRRLAASYLTRLLNRFRIKSHPHLLAGLLFFALTVGMTWPLILQLNTHVTPGQQPAMSVSYLGLWTLAWNHHWFKGQSPNYWDANHFFPHEKTLAYSEPQLGIALLTLPVVLFGGNTVLAYNIALLMFFFGAGMAVYALCWWIFGLVREIPKTDRCVASITAGILYAFTPYMFEEIAVIQLLATAFPPLCLLGLHRFFHKKSWSSVILVAIGFLGCWYTCAYYGLFLSVFVVCFTILFWHRDLLHCRNLLRGLVTVTILTVCLVPLADGMLSAKVALSQDWDKEIVRELSAVFMMYLRLPSSSLSYGRIFELGTPEKSLFLGGMLLCLASVGAMAIFFKQPPLDQTGPKTHLIHSQARSLLRRCNIFYISMAFVAFLLSLGMALAPIHTKGLGLYQILAWLSPYNLLYKFVPGFSSIRSPYRFSIFLALFLAVLAGAGVLWLCRRVRSQWRWVLILFLISVMIFELWPAPLRFVKVPGKLEEVPHIYQHVKTLPSDAVLIEFPLATSSSERGMESTSRYMYFSTFHWRRLVDGYTTYAPRSQFDLKEVLAVSKTKPALSALKAFGIQYVTAHWNDMTAKEKTLLRNLEVEGNLIPLFRGRDHTLFQIDNTQYEAFNTGFPSVERLAIYESETQHRSVTLCFYYQIDSDQSLLITPWKNPMKNPIECEISWYNFGQPQKNGKPVLVQNVPYNGSQLLHAGSNAIAIDISAPPPGKYRVLVRHRLASHSTTKTGICEIYPHGFVRFREEP